MVTAHCEGISGRDKWTLVNVAEAVFDLCEISEYQATLVLVSDDDIRSLNKEFRGLDEITDVLSFSAINVLDELTDGKSLGLRIASSLIIPASIILFI